MPPAELELQLTWLPLAYSLLLGTGFSVLQVLIVVRGWQGTDPSQHHHRTTNEKREKQYTGDHTVSSTCRHFGQAYGYCERLGDFSFMSIPISTKYELRHSQIANLHVYDIIQRKDEEGIHTECH